VSLALGEDCRVGYLDEVVVVATESVSGVVDRLRGFSSIVVD